MKINSVDNSIQTFSVASAHSYDSETDKLEVPCPVLIKPGTTTVVPSTMLSDESLIQRKMCTRSFIIHLVSLGFFGASFGLSLAATILSGGAGLPLAIATGSAMLIVVGDTCCALYNLIQVYNDRNPLKTDNDSIVLAVNALMTMCGADDSRSQNVGDLVSCSLRVGLALSPIFLPFPPLSSSMANIFHRGSVVASSVYIIGRYVSELSIKRLKRQLESVREASTLSPEMKEMVAQIVESFERSRARLNAPVSRQVCY